MNPTFSIILDSLDRVPPDALEHALVGLNNLVTSDATHLARYAFGILAEHLPLDTAVKVRDRLDGAGVRVEIVPQAEVPVVPPIMRVQHLVPGTDGVSLTEHGGKSYTRPWSDVKVLALGVVRRAETEVLYDESVRTRHIRFGHGTVAIALAHQFRSGSIDHDRILFELITSDVSYELRLAKESNPFGLLHDLTSRAPNVERTAGCEAALQFGDVVPIYPSLHAYQNEIRWRLFRAHTGRARLKTRIDLITSD